MYLDIYKYIVDNREVILKRLDIDYTKTILEKANSIWNYLDLNKDINKRVSVSAIDSSWNLIPYHGFYLYAVDALSIKNDESIVGYRREVDIDTLEYEEDGMIIYNPRVRLESKAMEMEYELIKESIGKTDIILVDGSLQARLYSSKYKRSLAFYEYANNLINREDVIFISKRSESRSVLKGKAGDIYYFDHANFKSGYSDPHYDNDITIIYARLADHAPCLKIEFGTKVSKSKIEDILFYIKQDCIYGYPYTLTLAHEKCKIEDRDMRIFEDLLGLQLEFKGREVIES